MVFLIELLHEKRISSFLVMNGQHPDLLARLDPVTQLYVSVDAPNKVRFNAPASPALIPGAPCRFIPLFLTALSSHVKVFGVFSLTMSVYLSRHRYIRNAFAGTPFRADAAGVHLTEHQSIQAHAFPRRTSSWYLPRRSSSPSVSSTATRTSAFSSLPSSRCCVFSLLTTCPAYTCVKICVCM